MRKIIDGILLDTNNAILIGKYDNPGGSIYKQMYLTNDKKHFFSVIVRMVERCSKNKTELTFIQLESLENVNEFLIEANRYRDSKTFFYYVDEQAVKEIGLVSIDKKGDEKENDSVESIILAKYTLVFPGDPDYLICCLFYNFISNEFFATYYGEDICDGYPTYRVEDYTLNEARDLYRSFEKKIDLDDNYEGEFVDFYEQARKILQMNRIGSAEVDYFIFDESIDSSLVLKIYEITELEQYVIVDILRLKRNYEYNEYQITKKFEKQIGWKQYVSEAIGISTALLDIVEKAIKGKELTEEDLKLIEMEKALKNQKKISQEKASSPYFEVWTSTDDIPIQSYVEKIWQLSILITSAYDNAKGEGYYKCIIEYDGEVIIIEDLIKDVLNIEHVTALGILEAVKRIPISISNISVNIVSSISLGLSHGEKHKTQCNAEIVDEIIETVVAQGNRFVAHILNDRDEEINEVINKLEMSLMQ